ncbi:voltage-gated purine nucleotide uniporter SLC17A9 isoform X2 [Lethenteron reissneri]|uniref:voltage-gated purine nucleotide uniporter SLC17A9 isoform X2 n=1 Tax=Lethenteron reissneri TaxID=7753 RepID=UPI002AB7A58D|nr:voltage-gated purine nucleotide uniporter SLC17A9 isoform X2 [Lethenteron reissneri]
MTETPSPALAMGYEHRPLGSPSSSSSFVLSTMDDEKSLAPRGASDTKTLWSRQELRVWVAVLFCGNCLLYCARAAPAVCAVVLSARFGWDKAQAGTMLGSFFWGYALTQIVGGHLSDRIGGDKMICLSMGSWGLVTLMMPVVAHLSEQPLPQLIFVRFCTGFLQGVHFPSMSSLFSSRVPESERAFIASTACSGSHFGALVVGGIGYLLMEAYGWESLFILTGLSSMLWAYLVWRFLIQKRGNVIAMQSLYSSLWPTTPGKSPVPWGRILTKPPVWAVIIAHFCLNNCFYIMLSWLPTYFHETFKDSKGWVFNVVPWLVSIPMAMLSGYLADLLIRHGVNTATVRKLMQVVALGNSCLFASIMCRTESFSLALLFAAISIGSQSFHLSGVSVNVQDLAPSCSGALFGIMNTAGALPGFFGVYVAGYMVQTTGSWTSVFNYLTAVNIFGLSFFLIFGKAKRIDL